MHPGDDCVPQAWYLAVDMQCYIIFSPIFLLLKKSKRRMVLVMSFLIFVNILAAFWTSFINGLPATGFSYS
ncbi:hypothetical protein JTB14_032402 [Gonioctena quinquepunctata]|nr:hypothetical protein JTB14_032402 [Gonioctena quinquepunctata]